MHPVEHLLRRLALNNEKLVGSVVAGKSLLPAARGLDRKAEALVQAGAVLSGEDNA